jgi:hypothetical protein
MYLLNHVSAETLTAGRMIPSDSNKNVDVKFSAHDTFLEKSLSGRTNHILFYSISIFHRF